jgi:hypothetical protein
VPGGRKSTLKVDPNDAYGLPPGRVIVTPETPFGPIDREADTAFNLWKQLQLPVLADETPQSSTDSTESLPRLEKGVDRGRLDRGRRGVERGNIRTNRRFDSKFMDSIGTDEDIERVLKAVDRIDKVHFGLPSEIPINIIRVILLAKRQLIIADRISKFDEKAFSTSPLQRYQYSVEYITSDK